MTYIEAIELLLRRLTEKDKIYGSSYKTSSLEWLFTRLNDEVYELNDAIFEGYASRKDIINEALDVAICALLIVDNIITEG